MSTIRLRYVNCFVDRHGRPRAYFRWRGHSWPLPMPEGSAAFMDRYRDYLDRIADTSAPSPSAAVAYVKGSVGWVIEKYLAHAQFTSKAAKTRDNYRRALDDVRSRAGGALLTDITPRGVRILRDQIAAERATTAADMAVKMISLLWQFGGEFADLDLGANPAHRVAKVHAGGDGHQPWPQDVLDRFGDGAPAHLRLAFLLLLYTGQRIGDVCGMQWCHFDGERIAVRQEKTDTRLWIPVEGKLLAALNDAPRVNGHMLNGTRGQPMGKDWLSDQIKTRLVEIGAPEYVPHGLRKNAAIALAEAGCSDHEIASITGHKDLAMIQLYTRAVRNYRLAKSAVEKRRLAAEAEAAKVVALHALAKPAAKPVAEAA
jgi:integrase